jgi:hypothetical protein
MSNLIAVPASSPLAHLLNGDIVSIGAVGFPSALSSKGGSIVTLPITTAELFLLSEFQCLLVGALLLKDCRQDLRRLVLVQDLVGVILLVLLVVHQVGLQLVDLLVNLVLLGVVLVVHGLSE